MIIGRTYWILIWWLILAIGVAGLGASIYWGLQTKWKNVEEVLRATGTVTVSVGMLLLLKQISGGAGEILLVASLFCFVLAFILGRRPGAHPQRRRPGDDPPPDEPAL